MTFIYALIGITLIIIMIHMDDDEDPPSGKLVPIPIRVNPGDRR